MSWLRWWVGAVNDPKWRLIATKANCRPGDCVAVWLYLLEEAKEAGGDISAASAETCSVILGFEEAQVEAIIAEMRRRGMIDGERVAAWEKRQPKREDDSRERVRASRARGAAEKSVTNQSAELCNGDVTQCNAPESETESETESEKIKSQSSGLLPRETRTRQRRHAASAAAEQRPFPIDGSISFSRWAEIARNEAPGLDVDLVASQFRSLVRSRDGPEAFKASNVEARFRAFCREHRKRN